MFKSSSPSPRPFVPVSITTSSPSYAASRPTAGPSYSPRTLRKSSLSASPRPAAVHSSSSSGASSHPPRSPKRPTADAATQYTPPDWPPTSSRSSHRRKPSLPFRPQSPPPPTFPAVAGAAERAPAPTTVADDGRKRPSPTQAPAPPNEPILRETPQTSLAGSRAERASSPNEGASSDVLGTPAAKRPRPSGQPPKALPADFKDCPPKILATLISGLMMDLIQHNDRIQVQDNHLTRFHSRTPPGISVHDYLQRLTFHATLPSPILLSIVFYIDRLCSAFEAFTINSLTVHRFLIAAATVAAKGLMDVFWTNSTYAKVGGVSIKELALLELELLVRIEWRIIPDMSKLAEYYRGVVDRHPDYVLEEADSGSELSPEEDSMETDSQEQEQEQ